MLTDLAAGAVSHLNYQAGYTKGYTNGFKVLLCLSSCPRACPSPPLPPSVAFDMGPSGPAAAGTPDRRACMTHTDVCGLQRGVRRGDQAGQAAPGRNDGIARARAARRSDGTTAGTPRCTGRAYGRDRTAHVKAGGQPNILQRARAPGPGCPAAPAWAWATLRQARGGGRAERGQLRLGRIRSALFFDAHCTRARVLTQPCARQHTQTHTSANHSHAKHGSGDFDLSMCLVLDGQYLQVDVGIRYTPNCCSNSWSQSIVCALLCRMPRASGGLCHFARAQAGASQVDPTPSSHAKPTHVFSAAPRQGTVAGSCSSPRSKLWNDNTLCHFDFD